MSIPELNKSTYNIQNESAKNINSNQQENTNPAMHADMDPVKKETVTPEPLTLAKSIELVCIDMKSVLEPQVGIRDETGPLVNVPELTDQRITQRERRRKLSFKGLYEYVLRYGKQSQAPSSIWDQIQPEQTVWMQYGEYQEVLYVSDNVITVRVLLRGLGRGNKYHNYAKE